MNNPTTPPPTLSLPQRPPQAQLHRVHREEHVRERYNRVGIPRQGLLFDSQPPPTPKSTFTPKRKTEEFFPRLFRVNSTLTQTLLYGHFRDPSWLQCNLSHLDTFRIDLKFKFKCFVAVLGWEYLEYCEEVIINNVEMEFPFQHFHWWFEHVQPSCTLDDDTSGR